MAASVVNFRDGECANTHARAPGGFVVQVGVLLPDESTVGFGLRLQLGGGERRCEGEGLAIIVVAVAVMFRLSSGDYEFVVMVDCCRLCSLFELYWAIHVTVGGCRHNKREECFVF